MLHAGGVQGGEASEHPPDMALLPPQRSVLSSISTFSPASAPATAAARAATPVPATIRSKVWSHSFIAAPSLNRTPLSGSRLTSMHTPNRSRNRGPAAAAENRAAIIAAARRLFAEEGYRVPLSAIGKAAGVGQGVLYRHFRNRLALAFAVFGENYAELERVIADTPGPECFWAAWRLVVRNTVESSAIVEMVIDARTQFPESLGAQRLERLLAEPLARAQRAGLADPSWSPHDVLLLQHMTYGVVLAQGANAPEAVHRALALIDPRLVAP